MLRTACYDAASSDFLQEIYNGQYLVNSGKGLVLRDCTEGATTCGTTCYVRSRIAVIPPTVSLDVSVLLL